MATDLIEEARRLRKQAAIGRERLAELRELVQQERRAARARLTVQDLLRASARSSPNEPVSDAGRSAPPPPADECEGHGRGTLRDMRERVSPRSAQRLPTLASDDGD